jgi:hypothetical protein
LSPQQHKIQYS